MMNPATTRFVEPLVLQDEHAESRSMQNNVDCETILKSLIFMADGVATTIGANGARAAMRQAGHRAAVDLLEALPLQLEVDVAIQRVGPVMQELGFVRELVPNGDSIIVRDDLIADELRELGLEAYRHPACYYTVGLFEGFVYVLSHARVPVARQEMTGDGELWTLQRG